MDGNHSIIAFKSLSKFTLDYTNWFSEGQFVDLRYIAEGIEYFLGGTLITDASNPNEIRCNNKGVTVFIDPMKITYIKAVERRSGTEGGVFSAQNPEDNLIIVRKLPGITFDLSKWYYIGQTINISTDERDLKNVLITGVSDRIEEGYITISDNGNITTIPAEKILSISHVERRIDL